MADRKERHTQNPVPNIQYPIRIRPMTISDVARLPEIDPNFESAVYLDVVRGVDGLNVTWQLIERPLDTPFVCDDFDFDDKERREITRRFKKGDGMWLVAEAQQAGGGRLVGMVDVQREAWRELMQRVIKWGRRESLRAIILETQTNNWSACRFYQRFGFQLTGIDDHFYTNSDIANKEVAIFWTYEL
jgi:GNAT superfamily N-acetyltransferase